MATRDAVVACRGVSGLPNSHAHRVRTRTGQLFDRLGWAGTALAGAVVGHALTYLAAFVSPSARLAVLDQTGHFYWSFAIAAAVALGIWSAITFVVRHLRKGEGKPGTPIEGILRSASRLSVLQVALFACFEVGERLVSGAPLSGLLGDGIFPLALVIQPLVALGLALLLRGLAKAAEIVARAFRSLPALRSLRVRPLPAAPPGPIPVPLSGAWGLRGPPSA